MPKDMRIPSRGRAPAGGQPRAGSEPEGVASRVYDESDIRRRAYEIYLARGAGPGTPESDWQQAELEFSGRDQIANTP